LHQKNKIEIYSSVYSLGGTDYNNQLVNNNCENLQKLADTSTIKVSDDSLNKSSAYTQTVETIHC